MNATETTQPSRWPLRFAWLSAAAALLAAGLLFVRVVIVESLLASSRSIAIALITGQPANDIQQRLASIATKHQFAKDLDFGAALYSDEAFYFAHGISMIRVGTANGVATDIDIRKLEFK